MGLLQLLQVLRRRWVFVVSLVLASVVASGAITYSLTPTYQASARIYLAAPASTSTEAFNLSLYTTARIASYADLTTDPAVLQRVIDRVGISTTPEELAGSVDAQPVPETAILQVSVTDPSPETARELTQATVEEIIDLVQTLEAVEVDGAAEVTVPPIVARPASPATVAEDPVFPRVGLNLLIGALLGFIFGVAGAILRELLDTSITTPTAAAEASGVAVMATIPFDQAVPKRPLISDSRAPAERVDAFSVLRTNLQFANLDEERQVLIVTSALPEEGKTITSTNLAVTFAKTGRRVLIIDCDLRKPRVASVLGLESSVGLLTVLVGQATLEECIQQDASGVDFLATGPKPPNPAEVLGTQAMSDLLARLRGMYDVVIIDAPPLLPVADPAVLASHADGVLLVVRHGETTVDAVHHAVERITSVGGRVMGVVLNMAPRREMSRYGYGYGYGYGETAELAQDLPRSDRGADAAPPRRRRGARAGARQK